MRFSEFIADKENVWLQDVIPLLQLIYVNSHDWSVDDSIPKVIASKRKYVTTNVLVHNITDKIIEGELGI